MTSLLVMVSDCWDSRRLEEKFKSQVSVERRPLEPEISKSGSGLEQRLICFENQKIKCNREIFEQKTGGRAERIYRPQPAAT